jgi:hypothetical protein
VKRTSTNSIIEPRTLLLRIRHIRSFSTSCRLLGLVFTASTLAGADVSGDWEFAGKYLGDVSSLLSGY